MEAPNEVGNPPAKITSFDYGSLAPDIAKYLRGEANRIRQQYGPSIVQIGKALIRAKRYLCHGEFICWVECEVGIPARTAQAYMRVGEWVSDKSARVAHLSASVLYMLSARSAPQDFVASILASVNAGEALPSVALLRQELKAFREAKKSGHSEHSTAPSGSGEADPSLRSTNMDGETEGRKLLREAVMIVRHGLSARDFRRFRDIITCEYVLEDDKFSHNILEAFLTCEYRRSTFEKIAYPLSGAADRLIPKKGEVPCLPIPFDPVPRRKAM